DHDGGQTGCTGLCARGCRVRLLILIEEEFRTAKGIRILLPRHPSVSLQGSSSCRGSRPFVCKLLQTRWPAKRRGETAKVILPAVQAPPGRLSKYFAQCCNHDARISMTPMAQSVTAINNSPAKARSFMS